MLGCHLVSNYSKNQEAKQGGLPLYQVSLQSDGQSKIYRGLIRFFSNDLSQPSPTWHPRTMSRTCIQMNLILHKVSFIVLYMDKQQPHYILVVWPNLDYETKVDSTPPLTKFVHFVEDFELLTFEIVPPRELLHMLGTLMYRSTKLMSSNLCESMTAGRNVVEDSCLISVLSWHAKTVGKIPVSASVQYGLRETLRGT